MDDSVKYLIHADITANGVVERSDVVGAVFGQTEGLLGDDLDLRELQEGSKVGRVEVDVESEGGQSFGEITIASGLDRVETAILAASLETIERVGPCRASVTVTELEDVRSAKRREVVERATELLAEFEADAIDSRDIVAEVRQRIRAETITDYEGYPAGPRAADSDALVVVEGRADVLQLLQYGIKNAVAVEGTDVPDAIADLTRGRTTTAFLDGDRGGELILKELAQVGEVDYVAFAPPETSVEDLSRQQVMTALRDKVPYEAVADGDVTASAVATPTDGGQAAVVDSTEPEAEPGAESRSVRDPSPDGASGSTEADSENPSPTGDPEPATVPAHVREVIEGGSDAVRLLDGSAAVIERGAAADAFDLVAEADRVPTTVVVDGPVTQRLLDVAAQRGVEQVVGATAGEFVKRPTAVRVRTAEDF